MPRLRVLSGREVVKVLREFGFHEFTQKGSHIKVCRIVEGGQTQSLTVPNHDEMDRGTLHAIYRQAPGLSRKPRCALYSIQIDVVKPPDVFHFSPEPAICFRPALF